MNGVVFTAGHVKEKVAGIKVKLYKVIVKYKLNGNSERNPIDDEQDWVTRDATDSEFGSLP